MNALIPMAGAGSRFADAGYKTHKPAIPTTYLKTGKKHPMVVCAAKDLCIGPTDRLIFIDRDFHKTDGIEKEILNDLPHAEFITIDYLTDGQASTCLLAKMHINNDAELLIAGCDNGMVYNLDEFNRLKAEADVLVFTYRNNASVAENPNAYGWCKVDNENTIIGMSVKKAISANPANDHAVVATFWFKKGSDFVKAAEKMIAENDRINGEFYVDQVITHAIELGLRAKVFEIEHYLGWGTPKDYENYEATLKYWHSFIELDNKRHVWIK